MAEAFPWRALRWLFGLFFLGMGLVILGSLITGLYGSPPQPTEAAQRFTQALANTRFMDPLLGVVFVIGGSATVARATAPLGLVLLAPPVAVIVLFHLLLSGQWPVGLAVAATWSLLAYRQRERLAGLWRAPPR